MRFESCWLSNQSSKGKLISFFKEVGLRASGWSGTRSQGLRLGVGGWWWKVRGDLELEGGGWCWRVRGDLELDAGVGRRMEETEVGL